MYGRELYVTSVACRCGRRAFEAVCGDGCAVDAGRERDRDGRVRSTETREIGVHPCVLRVCANSRRERDVLSGFF